MADTQAVHREQQGDRPSLRRAVTPAMLLLLGLLLWGVNQLLTRREAR